MDEVRRYPRVRYGPSAGPRLEWENAALLFALQASQGLIGPEIRAMSVQTEPDGIVIHVCLREDNEAITEDLDDLVSELEALLFGVVEPPVQVTVTKHVGETDARWPGYSYRRLFLMNDRERP